MALHDSLRDLVSVRGAGVVDEAEELRGALDDFLAEDEATLGELNLLVDAVRLGGLRRVLDVLDHGASPEAAVREAGAALARDRGTDDPTRSCWALATLCFALGKVDESMVRMFRADAGTMPAPTSPPEANGPAVARGTGTAERPPTQVIGEAPPVSQPAPVSVPAPPPPTVDVRASYPTPTPQYVGPVPPVIPEERSSRAGVYLLVLLVALLFGGLVAAGLILLRSNNDEPTASDDPSDGSSDTGGPGKQKPPIISNDEMLVPYEDDDKSVIYRVDVIDGGFEQVTGGPEDVLPTLSPDRRTMTYDVGPKPLELYRWDLESASYTSFFADPGPCDHALRPGWSLDGSQVALSCTGSDEFPDGIWLADADGTLQPEPIVDDSLVRGSPTWVSDTEFIYGRQDDESDDAPLTFWKVDITDAIKVQLDLGIEGLQLTHADYSPEADKVLFLVSPRGGKEIGDVWTMDPDGGNTTQLAVGNYAHPVWSPDGNAIGVTIFEDVEDADTEVLGYIPLEDPDSPVVASDVPPGNVGIPVWATR